MGCRGRDLRGELFWRWPSAGFQAWRSIGGRGAGCACLMVAGGALPLEDAYKAVELDTLTLLLGMMIVVANLRLSGFFAQASAWVMRRAHHPLALLGL